LASLLSFLSRFLSPSVVLTGGREALLAIEAESSLLLPSPSRASSDFHTSRGEAYTKQPCSDITCRISGKPRSA
jgi:hypothetical protein